MPPQNSVDVMLWIDAYHPELCADPETAFPFPVSLFCVFAASIVALTITSRVRPKIHFPSHQSPLFPGKRRTTTSLLHQATHLPTRKTHLCSKSISVVVIAIYWSSIQTR